MDKAPCNLKLPITVVIAVKNEAINLPKCLIALSCVERIVVVDSKSTDLTAEIATSHGADVYQFESLGSYPKKRQWSLDNIPIKTRWVLLLDADEVVSEKLWREIRIKINSRDAADAYMISKGYHFLGKRMRFGGFSFKTIALFKTGVASFEKLSSDIETELDMEVHERLIVRGTIGSIKTPLIHEDFKGLEAYIARHNKYSTWEAQVRHHFFKSGYYGEEIIIPKLFGNPQERRRWLKLLVIYLPCEHWIWFFYHYFFCFGFLHGVRGLIACQIRASYIAQVRAKVYELRHHEQ